MSNKKKAQGITKQPANMALINAKKEFDERVAQRKIQYEEMKAEHTAFNEQTKLFDRLKVTEFTGEIHPRLCELFIATRKFATVEKLGGIESFMKLLTIDSMVGLSYEEIGNAFNFIESLTGEKCESCGFTTSEFLEILSHTYTEMAIGVWNKNVDVWKQEIAAEKQAIADHINETVAKWNVENDQFNAKQPKSRADRKAVNATLTATKTAASN